MVARWISKRYSSSCQMFFIMSFITVHTGGRINRCRTKILRRVELSCRIKSSWDYRLNASLGLFLRYLNSCLREFRRNQRKILYRRLTSATRNLTWHPRLPVLSAKPLDHWWGELTWKSRQVLDVSNWCDEDFMLSVALKKISKSNVWRV